MVFKHITPILHSGDILKSIGFYTEVLGFDRSWHAGDPPNFGAVIKDSVEIFFSRGDTGMARGAVYLVVDDVDAQYSAIIEKGGNVLSPPATYEWNMRECLVEDPDGNHIRFGQHGALPARQQSAADLPREINIRGFVPGQKIILDYPPVDDLKIGENSIPFPAAVFAAVAEDRNTGKVVGSVYLIGETGNFYYVRNLFVHPLWRKKKIATALMLEVTAWLEMHREKNISVWLHSAQTLNSFYKQFGFSEVFGMFRPINPENG